MSPVFAAIHEEWTRGYVWLNDGGLLIYYTGGAWNSPSACQWLIPGTYPL